MTLYLVLQYQDHARTENITICSFIIYGCTISCTASIYATSSSALRRGPPSGAKSKKSKSSTQYTSTGLPGKTQASNPPYDPLIGRKVWTRWPEDNHFYEAVITDYNRLEELFIILVSILIGAACLVYDINTADETWDGSSQRGISPEDIRWEGDDPAISRRGGRPGPGPGIKKSMAHGGGVVGAGRGRGNLKGQGKRDFPLTQNGVWEKDTLIKEVEKVFGANHPDPVEIEKAKKVLNEHEQALVDAIARLEDASDGESDGEHPYVSRTINGSTKAMEKTAV
ncbi:hypothetical protein CXB51_036495 [Gossypium anomalum]|uniref:Uncharacterized protein n=1 Tax=Gossypium anomalum TaxID=47600 RepID=A0A8J6CHZ0_9ROSI|nr:hypothetical protein CXB51_036495 [Gossypium anomalum]